MFRKRTYEVTFFRPMQDSDPEFKTVEVKARTKRQAEFRAILSTPGLWTVMPNRTVAK